MKDSSPPPMPSGAPLLRRALCALAQPCLKQPQMTPRFMFQEATVLLIESGRLDLDDGTRRVSIDTNTSLLLVEPNTVAHLQKTPGGADHRFRSVFLSLPDALLDDLQRNHPTLQTSHGPCAAVRSIALDNDLGAGLRHIVESIQDNTLSDERLRYRLLDWLLALAERGQRFSRTDPSSTARRLRRLINEQPTRQWTAQSAGKELAMSAATLRRRLSGEQARFEDLLVDVRMHHALMLMQTTGWGIAHIAQACGYKSRARFSERFQARFGYPPSAVR